MAKENPNAEIFRQIQRAFDMADRQKMDVVVLAEKLPDGSVIANSVFIDPDTKATEELPKP